MDEFLFTLCRPAHPPDFGTRDWTPMTIRTSEHLVLWSHGLSSVMSHHRSVNDSYSLYREYSVTTTERGWVAIMLRTYTRLWNSHVPCGFSRHRHLEWLIELLSHSRYPSRILHPPLLPFRTHSSPQSSSLEGFSSNTLNKPTNHPLNSRTYRMT